MTRSLRLALVVAGMSAGPARADGPVDAAHRIAPEDPGWSELGGELRARACIAADFTEERWFPFKRTPTVLHGEVRISADRGLSLSYLDPDRQVVIIDAKGSLLRSQAGDRALPADPRADAANLAMLHLLRLDLGALARDFELYGQRKGPQWTITLVPRSDDLRRSLGRISVEGEGGAVRRIELRRSATQRVEILVAPPRPPAVFTPDEVRLYFR